MRAGIHGVPAWYSVYMSDWGSLEELKQLPQPMTAHLHMRNGQVWEVPLDRDTLDATILAERTLYITEVWIYDRTKRWAIFHEGARLNKGDSLLIRAYVDAPESERPCAL